MSKKGNGIFYLFFTILLTACNESNLSDKNLQVGNELRKASLSVVGSETDYQNLYAIISDSLSNWYFNKLLPDTSKDESTQYKLSISKYIIDSVFVINTKENKLLGSVYHTHHSEAKIWSDEMREFYGVKINNNWYFWMGGSTAIIRKNQHKIISYEEFHNSGVGSLGGYLDQNGDIRDEWFEARFKSGYPTFKERYKYKYILDGNKIDNEKDYWNYIWKRKGLGLWINKTCKDSIVFREQTDKKPLEDEEKREISLAVSRKIMNTKFPLKK